MLSVLFIIAIIIKADSTKECTIQYVQQLTNIFGIKYFELFKNVMLPSLEVGMLEYILHFQ